MTTVRLGLDIGGTKIRAMILNGERPLAQATYPTLSTTPEIFQKAVHEAVTDLLRQAGLSATDVTAVGVGIPGQVNQQTGYIYEAVNLNLDNYPLRAMLQTQFACPITIENDVTAAAIGAFHYLQQETPTLRHLAYVGIGTGIAAGLVLNGHLYRGAHGMAGEIGHMIVEPDGEQCNCGARGCLETIVAGPAIARQAAHFLPEATAQTVYAAARQGLPPAQALVRRVSTTLAQVIHWLVMTYDVEKVVLGGGVTSIGPAFLNPILEALVSLRQQSSLAMKMLSDDKLLLLPPTYDPGLWGAIYLAEQTHSVPTVTLYEEMTK
jgi:glucokinase